MPPFRPFPRLAPVRDKTVDPEKKLQVQELRKQVKEGIEQLRQQYFYEEPQEMFRELEESGETVRMLAELTQDFRKRLRQEKEEKNVLDFF